MTWRQLALNRYNLLNILTNSSASIDKWKCCEYVHTYVPPKNCSFVSLFCYFMKLFATYFGNLINWTKNLYFFSFFSLYLVRYFDDISVNFCRFHLLDKFVCSYHSTACWLKHCQSSHDPYIEILPYYR